jgi:hypothetical protein
MQEHNQLIFIHRSLQDRIESLNDQTRIHHTDDKLIVAPLKQIQVTNKIRFIVHFVLVGYKKCNTSNS